MHYLLSVQALRACAAIAVALCHFKNFSDRLDGQARAPHALTALASGVDIFFVISGFVMVYASREMFGSPGAAGPFLVKRIGRILPLYILTTAIAVPLMYRPGDPLSLAMSFLFIPFAGGPSYGVGWTLNFEMYFYALFAVALAQPRNKAAVVLGVFMIAAVCLGQFFKPSTTVLKWWSDPIILEFLAGMMLALLYERGLRLPGYLRLGLIAVGCLALWLKAPHGLSAPVGSMRFVYWGIPAAMIFAGAVLGQEIDFGWLRRPVNVLGDASYGIYLWHSISLSIIHHLFTPLPNQPVKVLVLSVAFVLSIAVAIVAHYHFERPALRLVSSLLARRKHAQRQSEFDTASVGHAAKIP